MRIGSILENQKFEKRIAITPEIVKKYISLGFEVCLTENYGSHLGISDEQYIEMGVKISKDEKEIINSSDIILQLGMLSDDKSSNINENQILIGILNPYNNKEKLKNLAKKKLIFFHLNCFQELQELSLWIFCLLKQILLATRQLSSLSQILKKRYQ